VAKVKPIPDGVHTVIPYLTLNNASEAIEFYKKAFGAKEVARMAGPDGRGIVHAEIKIGDSVLFLADECPGMGNPSPQKLGGTTVGIHLNVEGVDDVFARAVAAGGTALMPPTNMFWGDRFGKLVDPYGHTWSLSTHIEDVSHEEMERRGQAFFAEMAKQKQGAA
jgi:PhnB protein